MKVKIFSLIILVHFILWSHVDAAEKVGTTSFQFLKIAPDARSAAMGNAFVAVTNSSNAVFWNPGAITRIDNIEFSGSYYDYFLDVNLSAFSGAIPLGNLGTIGIQAMMWDYGSIEVTTTTELGFNESYTRFNPGLTGETINPASQCFGITYGRELTNKFSFGVTTKYATENLVREKKSTFLFDAGLVFRTGFRSLYLAATVRNFGPDVTFINESYPLPQTFKFGVSTYLIAPNNSFLLQSDSQSLLVSFDLSHPRDYDEQYNVGMEYTLMDMLALRTGYNINYDEKSLTFGIGLMIKDFRLDYAYEPFGKILDSVHKFTFNYSL